MTDAGRYLHVVPDVPEDASETTPPRNADAATPDWAKVDWDDIVPRLLLLAMSRLGRMTWRGRWNGPPPGAAEAEDFVNDAITKTMAGVRIWSAEKCTLFQHLAGIVVSDISHAATAADNRMTLADDGRSPSPGGWPPERADDRPGQEQEALWRSEQRRLLGYLDELDPKLAQMAELILEEDIDGSAELAERLGCSTQEIANLRKRMRRSVRAFLTSDKEVQP